MKNVDGRVVVISGAGSGIGRALALQFARRNCRLALSDIDNGKLSETCAMVESLGVECLSQELDVSDRSAMEGFAVRVFEHFGEVHIVINNAGVTLIDLVEKLDYADFEWIMGINFWGVVYGSKSFIPYLRQADEGHIVNVSSVFGILSLPLQSAYNASKSAVRGFTEALKMELSATNIGVTSVHPGGIKTDITRNSRIGDGALEVSREELIDGFDKAAKTTPEQAAAAIIRGIQKDKRRLLIGLDARLLDLVTRLFPGSYEKLLGLEREVKRRAAARAQSSS